MESIPLELEQRLSFDIGIGCCNSRQALTSSVHEIEYTSEERNFVSKLSSGVGSSSNYLEPRFARIPAAERFDCNDGSIDRDRGDDDGNSRPHHHHDAISGCVSPTQVTQLVVPNDNYGAQMTGLVSELLTMPSIVDESSGDDDSQDKGGGSVAGTLSESRCSPSSLEEELALEVGLSAHEYLEECFYTEASVLNREKFNGIPETTKSDFTIKVSQSWDVVVVRHRFAEINLSRLQ